MPKLTKFQERELNKLLVSVSNYFETSVSHISGKSRKTPLPNARKIFIVYAMRKLKIHSGPLITNFIGQTPAMAVAANRAVNNKLSLKPEYDMFLKFMFEKPVDTYIQGIRLFEPRLKIMYIYEIGLQKFKTNRYKNKFKSEIKDIIFFIHDKDEESALISLYAWFEDFATEFFDNPEELMSEFEKTGS